MKLPEALGPRPDSPTELTPADIARWRAWHRYEGRALCRALDMSLSSLYDWERGESAVSPPYRGLVWECWDAGLTLIPSRAVSPEERAAIEARRARARARREAKAKGEWPRPRD
jgi:hypothetical protein